VKEEKDDPFFERRSSKTSMGFYMAVLCSTFGIINLWRFPHIVIQNGGGAFLYVYFFIAAIVGSCFVMAELLIGKMAQKSLWVSLDRWTKERIALNPKLSFSKKTFYLILRRLSEGTILACMLVGAYYTVISSWVLNYFSNFALSLAWPTYFSAKMTDASEDDFWTQFAFAVVHLAICYYLVRRRGYLGVSRTLERVATVVAPVFLGLLLFLCFQSLTLPSAADAIRFLLYPDFTQVTYASLNQAIGHVILSLGLGLGVMSTFGSYFKSDRDITASGSKVMSFSVVMAVISVLIICPMVLGAPYAVFGPKLLFQTLPQLILKFPEGEYFLLAFYGTLYLSALIVSVGILDSLVTNFTDRWQWAQTKALNVCMGAFVGLMVFPLLASTLWRHFRWMGGVSLLETADTILVNYILPILALSLALSALFILPSKLVKREFVGPEIDQEISQFFPIWRVVILWVAPLMILLSFLLRLIEPF
jgi:NSS family neurotransmitter:Na+ symporter